MTTPSYLFCRCRLRTVALCGISSTGRGSSRIWSPAAMRSNIDPPIHPQCSSSSLFSQLPHPHIAEDAIEATVDPLSGYTNLALLIRRVCDAREKLMIHVQGNGRANSDDGKQVRLMPQPERSRPAALPQGVGNVVFIGINAIVSLRIHEEKVARSLRSIRAKPDAGIIPLEQRDVGLKGKIAEDETLRFRATVAIAIARKAHVIGSSRETAEGIA